MNNFDEPKRGIWMPISVGTPAIWETVLIAFDVGRDPVLMYALAQYEGNDRWLVNSCEGRRPDIKFWMAIPETS